MSDWMSRARANAIAQDEALRRRRLGLPPASVNRVRMQTNINSPAKPAGEHKTVTNQAAVKYPVAMLPRSSYFGVSDELKAAAEDGITNAESGGKEQTQLLHKSTRITDVVPDTDVPPEAEPTGLISPPSNHVQDAGAYAGYGDNVLQPVGNVKGKDIDLSKLDVAIREKILALQEAYEKHHREADREELERFLMEGFAQEMG